MRSLALVLTLAGTPAQAGTVCMRFKYMADTVVYVNDQPLDDQGGVGPRQRRGCVRTEASTVSVNASGVYVETQSSTTFDAQLGTVVTGPPTETGRRERMFGSYDMELGPDETVWLKVQPAKGEARRGYRFTEVKKFRIRRPAAWHGLVIPEE